MEVNYIGEHTLVAFLGKSSIYLGFVSALLAAWSYGADTFRKGGNWKSLGRVAFVAHALAVFLVIGLLFSVMLNRWYEFKYAYEHVSDDLEFRYLFAAFWEGQEGSFLLWSFWHVILGLVLLRTAKDWESPVMMTVAAVQAVITSMLLGLYPFTGEAHIGSNPFILLRDTAAAPIFSQPDYLTKISGDGMSILLKNYWMTIHPPVLFLGFAATVVPFAYALAGLVTGRHTEWIKPVFPWALFTAATLGTGIAMGGAWAYEALSFGGYWAWDPVENSSLVPWLLLVAGVHTALISKNTGRAIKSTYIFMLLSFLAVVYSTFLTRSGILGKTSVHAFTEMGLEWQLVLFVSLFSLAGLSALALRWTQIPSIKKEESIYSKEFWLLIGSFILLFSSILITITTSIPVFDKIADLVQMKTGLPLKDGEWAPPVDIVGHHNRFQVWIGILIGLITGFTQFLRYKAEGISPNFATFFKNSLLIPAAASAVLLLAVGLFNRVYAWQYMLLWYMGAFTVLCNLSYFWLAFRKNPMMSGSVVAHVGFGLLMIGVVFSGAGKDVISSGKNSEETGYGANPQANTGILLPKGKPVTMKEYFDNKGKLSYFYQATFLEESTSGTDKYYDVRFRKMRGDGKVLETFTVKPHVVFEDDVMNGGYEFKASNPSTRHALSNDVFNVVFPDWAYDTPEEKKKRKSETDTIQWKDHLVGLGDTLYTSKHYVTVDSLQRPPQNPLYSAQSGDIAVGLKLVVRKLGTDSTSVAQPVFVIRGNKIESVMDEVKEEGLKFSFTEIRPEENKFRINVAEFKPINPFIVLQSIVFPGVNLVWAGKILMMMGFLIAMVARLRRG